MSTEQFQEEKNAAETSVTTDEPQDNPDSTIIISLTQSDIDVLGQICELACKNYFFKPLPGYTGMKVFWEGKEQFFHSLKQDTQLQILLTAHASNFSPSYIRSQKNSSKEKYKDFIYRFIGFNEGQLLSNHGIAHAIRTAIISQISCESYVNNFKEYQNLDSRTLFCAMSASLLHDIGRCFGGDMYDVFGSLSAEIASKILNEVGGFSDDEIAWIKEAIDVGRLSEDDIENFSAEDGDVLDKRQLIACLMGDADSYEFERFKDKTRCDINFTSVKRLNLSTKDGLCPDEILNDLTKVARNLSDKIHEPQIGEKKEDYAQVLKDELMKLNRLK